MSLKSKAPLIIITTSIFLAMFLTQSSAKTHNVLTNEEYSKSIYPELLELRRDLLKHTEMSGQEKLTSAIVADYLIDLGLEVKTNLGGRSNIRKSDDKLILSAELFTTKFQDIEFVIDNLKQQIRINQFKGRFSSIEAFHEREGVNNDSELVSQASQIIKDSYGDNTILNSFGRIPFASEDFGHFQKTVPGVYFFIGIANASKGNIAFPHLPNFEVDKMIIHHGVSRFSTLIERRLQKDSANSVIENASLNQCAVGLYQGPKGNFVALTKADTEYNYTFKDNTNGIVNPKAQVTQSGDKSISLSNGDIWPLIDISTKNSRFMSEGIALQGRLMMVKNADKDTPLVVFAHGSESSGWIDAAKDPYLMLARGVSVFVYDKRGTGLSEGMYTPNFPLLAKDLIAASKEAKQLASGAYGRFGLIGLSQGGWVVPLAVNDAKADFIAIGYGLVADIREEDAAQVAKELRDAGFGEAELAKAKRLTDATALIATSGYKLGLKELDDARDDYKDEPWYTYVKGGYTGTFLQKTTQDLSHNGIPFYDSLHIDWSLNPLEVMKNVNVPQLWILAEEDREAPIALTMERLNVLKRQGKPIDIYVFPNTDHGMWEYRLDDQSHRKYTKVTNGFYTLLVDWAYNRKQGQYGKGRKQ